MPGMIPILLAAERRKEQELADKYRTLYDQDKKAHAVCIVRHGKRPELTGHESPEEIQKIHKAMSEWDACFEHDR